MGDIEVVGGTDSNNYEDFQYKGIKLLIEKLTPEQQRMEELQLENNQLFYKISKMKQKLDFMKIELEFSESENDRLKNEVKLLNSHLKEGSAYLKSIK